jgi:hypothetical protein
MPRWHCDGTLLTTTASLLYPTPMTRLELILLERSPPFSAGRGVRKCAAGRFPLGQRAGANDDGLLVTLQASAVQELIIS